MRNFLAHTDLTNPEKYNAMMNQNRNITAEKTQELNQFYGSILNLVGGFIVNLTLNNTFELEDSYGNTLYIAKLNKKDKVFELINSFDFQICSSLDEFDIIIRKYFKRKLY